MHFQTSSRRSFLAASVLLSAPRLALATDFAARSTKPSPSAAKEIIHSENVDAVLAFCRAAEELDLEAQMHFITDDSVYHNMPDRPCVGRARIRAMLGAFIKRADAIHIIIRNVAETPSGVVLTERLDQSHIKGKWIEAPVMGATKVTNGKVRWWRDYYDNQRLHAQMT
ncbi:MAG TPA: limonene-1,2-epoxide hydrolase family protein [Allosphingosinicella sp.]|jgi:limonene-1,2-epoxide hydrolase